MKTTGLLVLSSCVVMMMMSHFTEAFVAPPGSPQPLLLKSRVSRSNIGAIWATRQGKNSKEPDVTVFDAGDTPVSWEEYKHQKKPDEYKLDKVDEMTCWKTDECPVEDNSRFTKAWAVHSAERNPTMETHFDSEGEWEEESKWSKKWHADVGEDDLHEEIVSPTSKDGFGI